MINAQDLLFLGYIFMGKLEIGEMNLTTNGSKFGKYADGVRALERENWVDKKHCDYFHTD